MSNKVSNDIACSKEEIKIIRILSVGQRLITRFGGETMCVRVTPERPKI